MALKPTSTDSLKRAIQRWVLDPLAMRILQGEFGEGDLVVVDADDRDIRFSRQQSMKV